MKIWVDDVFFYADTEDELLDTLDEILARLESVGLFAVLNVAYINQYSVVLGVLRDLR